MNKADRELIAEARRVCRKLNNSSTPKGQRINALLLLGASAGRLLQIIDALQNRMERATIPAAQGAEIAVIANRFGWNGVDNPKILSAFIEQELEALAALRNQTLNTHGGQTENDG